MHVAAFKPLFSIRRHLFLQQHPNQFAVAADGSTNGSKHYHFFSDLAGEHHLNNSSSYFEPPAFSRCGKLWDLTLKCLAITSQPSPCPECMTYMCKEKENANHNDEVVFRSFCAENMTPCNFTKFHRIHSQLHRLFHNLQNRVSFFLFNSNFRLLLLH